MDITAHIVTPPGSDHLMQLPSRVDSSVTVQSYDKSDHLTSVAKETFPRDDGFTLVNVFDEGEPKNPCGRVQKRIQENEKHPSSSDLNVRYRPQSLLQPPAASQQERETISREANFRAIKEILFSREDRDNQRWAIDPTIKDRRVRLVAGCIPILPKGYILLIGSRTTKKTSKSENSKHLGLPKGGWELDERIEEGAIRETYEEAGVLGLLGPPLKSFCVPSSKNKESVSLKKQKGGGPTVVTVISHLKSLSAMSSDITNEEVPSDVDDVSGNQGSSQTSNNDKNTCNLSRTSGNTMSFCCNWQEEFVQVNDSPTSCPFGEGISHTHTCLTFFPLYVQQISEEWPEQMRGRYVLPIHGT